MSLNLTSLTVTVSGFNVTDFYVPGFNVTESHVTEFQVNEF